MCGKVDIVTVNNKYLLDKIEKQEERLAELESKIRYLELGLSTTTTALRSQQDLNLQVFKELNALLPERKFYITNEYKTWVCDECAGDAVCYHVSKVDPLFCTLRAPYVKWRELDVIGSTSFVVE